MSPRQMILLIGFGGLMLLGLILVLSAPAVRQEGEDDRDDAGGAFFFLAFWVFVGAGGCLWAACS